MESTILDTPSQIRLYRLLAIKGRLALERKGIRFKGGSTFALVKREFGFRGNHERVYTQFCEYVEKERGNV